jgi:hypothetical protein
MLTTGVSCALGAAVYLKSSSLKPLGQMNGFREEDFLEINQSETRIACGGHVC